ncbi:hypothetical protein ES706_00813 [subsurface metagenome]|uniref:Uncharacterized protein n=2 Tax=marine sediment metagenome TaxID=412755 RepID=X1DXN4_9ZZZZ
MGKGVIILLLIVIVFLVAAWYFEYLNVDALIEDIQGLLG